MCSCVINGEPHGPENKVATCRTYMRSFRDGEMITVEQFRAKAFPLIKDLIVNRTAFGPGHSGRRVCSVSAARRPTAARSWSRNRVPIWPWTPPRASATSVRCGM